MVLNQADLKQTHQALVALTSIHGTREMLDHGHRMIELAQHGHPL